MENSKQFEWKMIETSWGIESKPYSVPSHVILLDDFLICFSGLLEVYIFDLVNAEWSKIIFTYFSLQPFASICVLDQSTLVILRLNNSQTCSILEPMTISKTQVPWQIYSGICAGTFPYRVSYTAQSYQKRLYIFGGKDKANAIQDDLLIFNTTSGTYLQANSTQKPNKRYDHSSLIHDKQLFIYGGIGENNRYLTDIWAMDLENCCWNCIFSEQRPLKGFPPTPRCLSLIQAFENKLFFLRGKPENENQIFLSYDIEADSWENLTSDGMPNPYENPFCFVIYKNKFIISDDNIDFYEANLFNDGSLKLSNDDGINDVATDFKQLFKEKLFCDITFKVEDEEILAHKGILAGRSDYFRKMFTSKMSESQSQIIEVPGIKKDVFKALIEFLYCSNTIITEAIALDLLKLSEEYQLEKLKNRCETFLMHHLKTESVIEVINTADKLEAVKLRKAALEYILINIKTIKETVKLSTINESVLWDLIDRDLK